MSQTGKDRDMTSRLSAALATVALSACTACGSDDPAADRPEASPGGGGSVADREPYELGDVQNRLQRSGLNVTATGAGSVAEGEVESPLLDSVRYEIVPGGREFELYVFPTAARARGALDDLRETATFGDDGALTRARNVVAVFPDPVRGAEGYAAVRRVLDDLA